MKKDLPQCATHQMVGRVKVQVSSFGTWVAQHKRVGCYTNSDSPLNVPAAHGGFFYILLSLHGYVGRFDYKI